VQKDHDFSHGLLFGPSRENASRANRPDTVDLAQPIRCGLYDFKHLLAKGANEFFGVDRSHAPDHAGREVFFDTVAIGDAGGLELLAQICAAADTVAALSVEIERDGPVIRTARGTKPNPCLRDLLNHRAFITRTMTKLGINIEPTKAMGRPGVATSWVPPQEG
jgi:hypothetical protein